MFHPVQVFGESAVDFHLNQSHTVNPAVGIVFARDVFFEDLSDQQLIQVIGDVREGPVQAEQGAIDVQFSDAARCLRFGLSPCLRLALFLVSGLSAISDFRQQGPYPFNILLTPRSHVPLTDSGLWRRHFLRGYVAVQACERIPSLLAACRAESLVITLKFHR